MTWHEFYPKTSKSPNSFSQPLYQVLFSTGKSCSKHRSLLHKLTDSVWKLWRFSDKKGVKSSETSSTEQWRKRIYKLRRQEGDTPYLCLTQTDRLFSSWHAGSPVRIRQLWSGKEPGLTKMVWSNELRQSYHSKLEGMYFKYKSLFFASHGGRDRIYPRSRGHPPEKKRPGIGFRIPGLGFRV